MTPQVERELHGEAKALRGTLAAAFTPLKRREARWIPILIGRARGLYRRPEKQVRYSGGSLNAPACFEAH